MVAVALTIFKNALRIVTLVLLGAYVNPGFLYGRLHSESAVIFFLLSMVLLIPYLWLLNRGEASTTPTKSADAAHLWRTQSEYDSLS